MTIRTVVTKSDRKKFVELPWRLYRKDPNWVPPLFQDMYSTLNPQKNVLLRLGPHRHFLAERNGRPVGRLGVGMDLQLNRVKGKNLSYLTLFESIEDYAVAESLFAAGLGWLRAEGAVSVSGPQSPSNGDDYRGLLIKGFDSPPVLLNSYNPPYYMELFDRFGFTKEFDRHAYYYDLASGPSERLKRGVEAAQKRYGFTVRPINMKSLQTEMLLIKDILDQSVPEWPDIIAPSMEEIEAETAKLKQMAVPDLILVIEGPDGKPAGFSVALPDYNQVLPMMNGRLFPLGAIRFMMHKKSITGIRLFILFVTPAWRKKGVAAALYYYTMLNACRMGYTFGEGSTIHEFNTQMNLDAKKAGGDLYKVYRVYQKEL